MSGSVKIHATAIVDPKAQLGVEVEVGPYSIIGPNVVLGDRVRIAPHVVIEGHTNVGDETEVFQFASLGSAPQDLKYSGEPSTLVIGSRNKIREYVTIQPGTKHSTMTTIVGDGNLFMANSHIGHDCRVGNGNVFANSVALAGHVTVFNFTILGGMVGVHQFARIGDYAFLGAGSMVSHDIPPYCTGQGDRCHLRGLNLVGLKRAGFSSEDVAEIKKVYRTLFGTVGNVSKRMQGLSEELKTRPAIQAMLEFIESSERGVAQPARHASS